MKVLQNVFLICSASALMMACNSNTDSTSSMSGSDSTKGDSASAMSSMDSSHKMMADTGAMNSSMAKSSTEQDFINIAVPGNMKEMAWLNAGMARGSKQIQHDAAMMLKDHKKLGADVDAYLKKKPDLKAPAVDTTNVVDINDKTGNDWNKAWADKMVADHSDLLSHLKSTQSATQDADLKKLTAGAIPVVQSHLTMAEKLQAGMK